MKSSIVIELLSNDISRLILNKLNNSKKARFKELRSFLIHETGEDANSQKISKNLIFLENQDLIGVVDSPNRDFNSYYLTAKGLRTIRTFDSALKISV